VLDYIDYTNVGPNHSYGSLPDGQSFDRQEFAFTTPGGTNNSTNRLLLSLITLQAPSTPRTSIASLTPAAASVNAANPATINTTIYSLAIRSDLPIRRWPAATAAA